MVFQCFSKDSLEDCLTSVGELILYEIKVNPEAMLVFLSRFACPNIGCSKIYNYLHKLANVAILWIGSSCICLSPSFFQKCFRIVPDKVARVFK